jgi:hypothetical protein
VEVLLHAFLTSALDGGEWLASCSGHFTPREKAHDAHWIGGWLGPRTVLDAVVKIKIPSSRRESSPRTPIVQTISKMNRKVKGVSNQRLSSNKIKRVIIRQLMIRYDPGYIQSSSSPLNITCTFLNSIILRALKHGPQKRWYPTTSLHVVTTQKTTIWTHDNVVLLVHLQSSKWPITKRFPYKYSACISSLPVQNLMSKQTSYSLF